MAINRGVIALGVGAFLLLAFVFYWYEVRPSQIASDCRGESIEEAVRIAQINKRRTDFTSQRKYGDIKPGEYSLEDSDYAFQRCLQTHGIRI
jgi:hypothetical protein